MATRDDAAPAPRHPVRLVVAGVDTFVGSDLCARCPQGEAGCCAAPPGVEWSDVGRVVLRGGRDFLIGEIAAGRLRPGPRGLNIARVEAPSGAKDARRCVYHGPAGCTIPPDRRAATCNHYLCDDGFAAGGEGEGDRTAARARRALDSLVARHGAWDRAIADEVRARWPGGPPWDGAFLDALGEALAGRIAAHGRARRA